MTAKQYPGQKLLIVDDDAVIRQSFEYYLEDQGFEIITAENGLEGIEAIKKEHPLLTLTDLRMPEANGFDILNFTTENFPNMPVIVISGVNRVDDAVQALHLGAWDYLIKPVGDLSLLTYRINRALEKARLIRENTEYKEHLETLVTKRTEELNKKNRQLEISRRQIIGILSQAAEYRDFETGNHFLRVSEFAGCIARGMGWNEDDIHNIQLASPVHDIGKIGIPDTILLKSGKLTKTEWSRMKEHCMYGKMILKSNKYVSSFCDLDGGDEKLNIAEANYRIIETAANIALNHHEFWNGNGYPLGLRQLEIPIEARITAVADVYDALRSSRPYKNPWSEEKSVQYLRDQSGLQFDPEIIEVFMNNFSTIKAIQEEYRE